jgi:hypothetical protein
VTGLDPDKTESLFLVPRRDICLVVRLDDNCDELDADVEEGEK